MNKDDTFFRCPWVDIQKPDYVAYHDQEWGVPVRDDRKWFEFLLLESAQAGLSWYTVLRKRENYRAAFAGFDPEKVARFDTDAVSLLLGNAGIIRTAANRGGDQQCAKISRCAAGIRQL
jgi:DNA-3-methyladenine glycosylase I